MGLSLQRHGRIGLDIGTTAVRAAEIRGGDRNASITRFGQVLLERGAVVDGEIVDVGAVSRALATLWKRAGFPSKDVIVGVANRRVVVRQLELPAMSRQDLDGAIRFQAEEYIPIPLSEAVMDFEVLEEFTGPEGEALQRVMVVAAERTMIDPLIEALRLAKLEPAGIELSAYPLLRALAHENVVEGAEAVVDVGGAITNIVVHQGGRMRFTRTVAGVGGDSLTTAIVESMGIPWGDAETLKHKASARLSKNGSSKGRGRSRKHDDGGVDQATDVIASQMDRFVGELHGSIDFYTTQNDTLPLERVVLTGGGSILGGLTKHVSDVLRLPVERGHVFERVPVGKVRMPAEQVPAAEPFLAVAVGLAMGGQEA